MNSKNLLMAAAAFLALLPLATVAESSSVKCREGDIVFSSSSAGQGGPIMAATGSPYTHCGIVFEKDGKLMVLEAVQPVGEIPLETFIARSKPGTFTARRLKNKVPAANVQHGREWAAAQLGKNYDGKFLWDDEHLYCSELVWKIYQQAGVELCPPRRFKDYHLDDPKVKALIVQRYGSIDNFPLNEKVVAPSDLAESSLLIEVK